VPAQINDFASGRHFEKPWIGFSRNYVRQFEILGSDSGVLKLAAEVDAQLRRVPVLPNDPQFTIITDRSRFHDCCLSGTRCFQTADELLPKVLAAMFLG